MAGFTAINASTSDRLPTPAAPIASVTRAEQDASTCTAQHVREADAVLAVSEYLGIGHHDSKIVPAVVSHLQKASKKSRKGATDAQQGRQSKRHKSNNTLSTLHISEPAKEIATGAPTSLAETNKSLHTDSTSSRGGRKVSCVAVATPDSGLQNGTDLSHAVSVYAPLTSMDVVDSTSTRTSLDSVIASGNMGCVLYQTMPSGTYDQRTVDFSKPVMETCAMSGNMTDSQANGAVSSTRNYTSSSVHRPPRKAKADATQKNNDILCGRRPVQQAAHMIKSNSTGQPHRRRRSTADTFTADDSIEVLDEDKCMPVQLSYTSPEDVTQDAFEDELDDSILIDLAEAVEEDAKDSRRTPPPRNYKQNLREVDEHEDYGGALLSASERTFLSEFAPHIEVRQATDRERYRSAYRCLPTRPTTNRSASCSTAHPRPISHRRSNQIDNAANMLSAGRGFECWQSSCTDECQYHD